MAFDLNDEELKATRDNNGANICVGDYVRTDKGKIAKIKEIRLGKYKNLDEFINMYIFDNENWTTDRYILKHSKNIIDLIEVGDIVHTKDVLNEDYYYMFDEEMVQATKETIEEGIELVDILTHEQYSKNCYKEHKKENGELREELKNSISTLKIEEIINDEIEELFKEMDELDIYDEDENEEKKTLSDMIVLLKQLKQELLEELGGIKQC